MAVCVAVVLHGQFADTLMRLRCDLESRWSAGLSHGDGLSHLTVATVEGSPRLQQLKRGTARVAEAMSPFPVSGAGIGVFTARGGDSPVICFALTRTPRLSALHEAATHAACASGGVVDGLTQPEFWRPHVTLADTGLTPTMVGDMVRYLLEHGPRHWTVEVDNLSVVKADGSILSRCPLGGQPLKTAAETDREAR